MEKLSKAFRNLSLSKQNTTAQKEKSSDYPDACGVVKSVPIPEAQATAVVGTIAGSEPERHDTAVI